MQSQDDVCQGSPSTQNANAMPCPGDPVDAVSLNSSALHVETFPDPESHSHGLTTLLRLCQASLDASPENPKNQTPFNTSISRWTKHFTLQDLTSASAGNSIFSPHSGPFPGDGPAVYREIEFEDSSSADLQLSGGIVHPNSELRNSVGVLNRIPSAVKREQDFSDVAPVLQTEDNFIQRLTKNPQGVLVNSPKNGSAPMSSLDNSPANAPQKSSSCVSFNQPFKSPVLPSHGAIKSRRDSHARVAPVADILVPSCCECGTVIVGVWYRNRPYYTHWFRHPRYSALRSMLEQNRCKHNYLPSNGGGASSVDPDLLRPNKAGVPGESKSLKRCSAASSGSVLECAADGSSAAASVTLHDEYCAVTCAEELLAPKFMSLLCLLQFVKYLDTVEFTDSPASPVDIAPSPVLSKHVKLSAHIDSERGDGFDQRCWYSSGVDRLFKDLTSDDQNTKHVVVGCCTLSHWKRKPPGRELSNSVEIISLTCSAIF
jgi:hypothetical protein